MGLIALYVQLETASRVCGKTRNVIFVGKNPKFCDASVIVLHEKTRDRRKPNGARVQSESIIQQRIVRLIARNAQPYRSLFPLLENHVLPNDRIKLAKEKLVCELGWVLARKVRVARVGRAEELDENGAEL